MIEDISKSIKANMYERATSPLFGAFAISWAIWNYKTVLAILSSLEIKEKVSYIETTIYGQEWSLILDGAIFPLASAIIFILIYPHPSKWIYKYWNNQQKHLKEIKQQIEDDTPLTLDESRQIRRELLRLESDFDEEITKKNTEIDRLKDIIAHMEDQAKQTSKKGPEPKLASKQKMDDRINDEQESMLIDIAKHGGWVNDEDYLSRLEFDTVKGEYFLEDLESKKYLSRTYSASRGGNISTLTTKGKKFAIEIGAVS